MRFNEYWNSLFYLKSETSLPMSLMITLTAICAILILVAQRTAQPREIPDRISASEYRYSAVLVFILFLAIAFISAHRYGFCDTGLYRNICGNMGTNYNRANDADLPFGDQGFNTLMIFLNRCGFKPQSIIIFCSYVTFGIFIYTLYKYSSDLPFSLFLLFFLSYYTMINGIRQVLAAAILLLGLPFIRDRRFLLYAPLVWLAYTLHASALVMLPLLFVVTGRRMNVGVWGFFGVVSLFFVVPSLANSLLGDLLEDSSYQDYLAVGQTMGITRLIVTSIPLVMTIFYCSATYAMPHPQKGDPDFKSYRLIDILINMQFVSFGFTILGLRMVYFARICMYFEFVNALLLPYVIQHGFNKESARTIKHLAIILYFAYFAYQTYTYYNYGYFNDFRLVF